MNSGYEEVEGDLMNSGQTRGVIGPEDYLDNDLAEAEHIRRLTGGLQVAKDRRGPRLLRGG